jgi:hypothetical protein
MGCAASRRTHHSPPYPPSQLVMTLIAAAVRQAITLPTREARRLLALFKRMLPKTLAAMEKDVTA